MHAIELTDRQGEVLRAVVLEHIRSAEPVGSRAVARRFRMGISPATVRNVMVDLEEAGLLQQPHTSAGRVPTDRGYRVFVDRLMVREAPTRGEIVLLRSGLAEERHSMDNLLESISRALGRAAAQLGIAVSPKVSEGTLRRIEASPISEAQILLSFALSSGTVRTVLSGVETRETKRALTEALGWVNRKAPGLGLEELSRLLEREVESDLLPADWLGVFRLVIDGVDTLLHSREGERVHFSGATNIMAQPEFSDPERLRPIVAMMERRELLFRTLPGSGDEEGLRVIIGRENRWRPMRHCSLVLSSFRSGSARGEIGVIGPTRMPYPKLVPLVERMAQMISGSLEAM